MHEGGTEADIVSNEDILAKYGGFSFLESIIEGVQNLDPQRRARKSIFLGEADKRGERLRLQRELNTWISLLTETTSVEELRTKCEQKLTVLEKTLRENLLLALQRGRKLEEAYRSVALFYSNSQEEKLKNVTIVNASPEQLQDLDTPTFIDYIGRELKQHFDRLDLRKNYSLLVVPGYLGANKVVEKWARLAHENKVMLITDFAHLEQPDDVIDVFTDANLVGADIFKSNVCMTCNWIMARSAAVEVGEQEDLFVPPSTALAGRIYCGLMSQATAGKKHGAMIDVDAVTFDLRKSEISQLEQIGLIPMVLEYGKVMAFSARTLFNGDNLGLQTYSVVRVFDHISKVMFDFLNRRAFENWTPKMEKDLRSQIARFLNGIRGSDNLIEDFSIMRFEQDEEVKDRVYLDIHITPFFPAKSFVMRLDGYKGEDAETTWQSIYDQV